MTGAKGLKGTPEAMLNMKGSHDHRKGIKYDIPRVGKSICHDLKNTLIRSIDKVKGQQMDNNKEKKVES